MTEIEQAIFDIIKEPLTLGSVDDLGIISDPDAATKSHKTRAVCDAEKVAAISERDKLWSDVVMERCGKISFNAILGDIIEHDMKGRLER